jgi:hypothetical protein
MALVTHHTANCSLKKYSLKLYRTPMADPHGEHLLRMVRTQTIQQLLEAFECYQIATASRFKPNPAFQMAPLQFNPVPDWCYWTF